jgi:hypothetical protein
MHLDLHFGRKQVGLDLDSAVPLALHRQDPARPLSDPVAAIHDAIERPHDYPALRRALTMDDRIVLLVDDDMASRPSLWAPVLEQVISAGVAPEAITVLQPQDAPEPNSMALPAIWHQVHIEVHDPTDRRRLSYLATTRHGRRIYLNRTAVDADQLIVLARRKYDAVGALGAERAIYPAMSDAATIHDSRARMRDAALALTPVSRAEAKEVAWLLGAPFMIQLIEGENDQLLHVVAGSTESSAEAQRLLEARWQVGIDRAADVVIATITGDAARQTFSDLGRAIAVARSAAKPRGRIILLTEATPSLGPGMELVQDAGEPRLALAEVSRNNVVDIEAAALWSRAIADGPVALLSGLPVETCEELFVTPLENAGQIRRLVAPHDAVLLLTDAHRTSVVMTGEKSKIRAARRRQR